MLRKVNTTPLSYYNNKYRVAFFQKQERPKLNLGV